MPLEHVQQRTQGTGAVLRQVHAQAPRLGQVREQVADALERVAALGDGRIAPGGVVVLEEMPAELGPCRLVAAPDQGAQARDLGG